MRRLSVTARTQAMALTLLAERCHNQEREPLLDTISVERAHALTGQVVAYEVRVDTVRRESLA